MIEDLETLGMNLICRTKSGQTIEMLDFWDPW
jgi:hypothetical protein